MSKRCLTCHYHKQRWEEAEADKRYSTVFSKATETKLERLKEENKRLQEKCINLQSDNKKLSELADRYRGTKLTKPENNDEG